MATATDDDTTGEPITFVLQSDPSGLFEINGGEVSLAAGQTLDFEAQTSHQTTVRAPDGTNFTDQAVTINVTDVNDEAPGCTSGTPASALESTADPALIYTATGRPTRVVRAR